MPIQIEVFHPDRILVGIGRGNVTLREYGEFVAEVVKANLMHYRKIIDATGAESAVIDKDVLLAFDEQMRGFSKGRKRGDLARTFKALSSPDRPVEVFGSIHDARNWLRTQPIVE